MESIIRMEKPSSGSNTELFSEVHFWPQAMPPGLWN